MLDYILLMHGDGTGPEGDWTPYLDGLGQRGVLRGGSAVARGTCHRREGEPAQATGITGFVRLQVASQAEAEACVAGNPVYEAGGTVEVCFLPRD